MHVVKIGGAANVDVDAACADVAALVREGERLVLVHGGSDAATRLGEALGHPPRFVTSPSGHTSRLTDERTLEIFVMATAALNRRIVSGLQARGVDAFGLSGIDGRALRARRKEAIRVVEDGRVRLVRDDWTGTPESANAVLLGSLLDAGHTPVLAPIGMGAGGEALNVDGDRAAALVAAALRARSLVLLTAVPGLLRAFPDEGSLVRRLAADEIEDAIEWAGGRMKKKVLAAREALAGGVERVVIAGSGGSRPLRDALDGGGTHIEAARTVRGGARSPRDAGR